MVNFKLNVMDAIHSWIKDISADFDISTPVKLEKLAGDASIRTYYLVSPCEDDLAIQQFIIMQTPLNPAMSNFVKISDFLTELQLEIKVPTIYAIKAMPPQGFLLLRYLGGELLFKHLNIHTAENLYGLCLNRIVDLQHQAKNINLPKMDRSYIRKNLSLFQKWFLETYLNIPYSTEITMLLENLEDYFTTIFTAQPQTFVHLDYHSKNIMLEPDNLFNPDQKLGILDFQDAMIGPITYDVASLLQDAYITLPPELIERILGKHYEHINAKYNNINLSKYEFLKSFYVTGLQRHIKNLGIFARLKYVYNKPNYINFIPNLLNYIAKTCNLYNDPAIISLKNFLNKYNVIP